METTVEQNLYDPFQSHLPETISNFPRGLYEYFPAFKLKDGLIHKGYNKLAKRIKDNINSGLRVLIIDGYNGVDWNEFYINLKNELTQIEINVNWLDMKLCLKDSHFINNDIKDFLGGDDPLFGTHYPFGPEVFFDSQKIAQYRIKCSIERANKIGNLTIVYGTGSGLLELYDELWYIDIPKDLIQILAREKEITNLGENEIKSFGDFYKRCYFVEWPALNRLKKELLPNINVFIDLQYSDEPTFINGDNFQNTLYEISENPFRVRPWFFPGPWGGKFMMGHMGLDPEQPNYAWSYELIVPENGIIIESSEIKLEFSFDCLMFMNNKRVLGKQAANQFKYEWPIRFDYLDTIDGGNLSTQVHPRPNYIRREFGETYTQDEAYYIVASKPDSKVYIGLTENCNQDEFKNALENSIKNGKEVDIEKYVNCEPSKPHDLFLIPNGTVHCSGAGNLVLEISATTYIFTFRIYDYLRKDLEGKLRPLNIKRSFENIRFERRKSFVQKNLIAKPKLLEEGNDWKIYELYNKPFTFYNINRLEFQTEFEMETNDIAYTINLVEGEQVEIISTNGRRTKLSYLETMVIPAATKKLKFINKGNRLCKLVFAFVRPSIGITEPLNDPDD
ncbi:MAG: hypothetical protein STSR0008_01850 [Ignavibacterium sp.]